MIGRMRRARCLLLVLVLMGCAVEPGPPPLPVPEPSGRPLVPPATISGFGEWRGAGGGSRRWQHTGIDLRAALGTPVLAAADGTVLRVGRGPLAGRFVIVGHAGDVATAYFHLSEIGVVTGQAVSRGAVIGRTGATGNATTPHLHFGVCRRGRGDCGSAITAGWDDPAAWWVGGGACFGAGRAVPPTPLRLTYPIPCRVAPAGGRARTI
jgi:murein DD-endopeptidase MepM/ murein hydrolase activator NlpD